MRKRVEVSSSESESDSDDDVPLIAKVGVKVERSAAEASGARRPEGVPAKAKVKAEVRDEVKAGGGRGGEEAKKVKREVVRKEYPNPGQRRDTPSASDPQRKFYASLLKQVPSSEMATTWCLIHGLLPRAQAEQLARKIKPEASPKKARPTSAAPKRKSAVAPSRAAPAQKKARAASGSAAAKRKPSAAPKPPPKKRPVARVLDSASDSSDDDVPLAQRKKMLNM